MGGDGKPEVGQLDTPRLSLAGQKHILRLQIAMDDAARVRVFQGLADLTGDLDDFRKIRGAGLAEARALHQLHDEIGDVPVLADVVHRNDVGMVQRSRSPGLMQEPLPRLRGGDRLGENLDRHLAPQLEIGGAEDDSHPAAADLTPEFVAAAEDHAGDQGLDRDVLRIDRASFMETFVHDPALSSAAGLGRPR